MTATVHYGAFDFASLGCQPRPSRSFRFQREDGGALRKATHTITMPGVIIPDQSLTTLSDIQDDIAAKRLLLTALERDDRGGKDLRLEDIDSRVQWQYSGSDPGGNADFYETLDGVRIANLEIPDSPAGLATHEIFRITFEADVAAECSDGVADCFYRETITERNGIVTGVSYSGWVRVCVAGTCDAERDALIVILSAQARALFDPGEHVEETSSVGGVRKNDDFFCDFTVSYGTSLDPSGTSAERFEATSQFSLRDNRWDGAITARYFYKESQFSTVYREAVRLDGINLQDYIPPGGTLAVHSRTNLTVDRQAKVITSSWQLAGTWIHGPEFMEIRESISIRRPRPAAREHVHAWLETDTVPPNPTIQIGGLRALRVAYNGTITAASQIHDIPSRVATVPGQVPVQISDNVSHQNSVFDVQDGTSTHLFDSNYSQEYLHDDLSTWPGSLPFQSVINAAWQAGSAFITP